MQAAFNGRLPALAPGVVVQVTTWAAVVLGLRLAALTASLVTSRSR